jgi:cytochrome o ubiquinol oxidase subunit 3
MTTHESLPDTHQDPYSKTTFGFWVYLLTDLMMFAVLFATYAVVRREGMPLNVPCAAAQTFVLLTAAFTSGVAGAMTHRGSKRGSMGWWSATALLGLLFLGMEWSDLSRLVHSGNDWTKNASLSAYYTLLGTHGLHVAFGVLWVLVLLPPVWRHGITPVSVTRLTCLRMLWQFINIVWIFIFSFVYLAGAY